MRGTEPEVWQRDDAIDVHESLSQRVEENPVEGLQGDSLSEGIDMNRLASDYLLFGRDGGVDEDSGLTLVETLSYLEERGFADSSLSETRRSHLVAARSFPEAIERYCDFCGRPLTGVSYVRLDDGRDRCSQCSKTVVVGQQAYEQLFRQAKLDMLSQFGVSFPQKMSVRIVSADRMAKHEKRDWKPTEAFDPRTTYLVKRSPWRKGTTSILLENGMPRMALMEALAKCLTSVWQLDAWDEPTMRKRYGDTYDELVQGMGIWVGIQYLFLLNEAAYADRMRVYYSKLDDPAGTGFVRYAKRYPLSEGIVLEGDTPFRHIADPL